MPQSRPTLAIVIPAYNEEQRIEATLSALVSYQDFFSLKLKQVILVDDGSQDQTVKKAKLYQQTLPLQIIQHPRRRGKGAAVATGFRAVESDWALMSDADCATPWSEFSKFQPFVEEGFEGLLVGSRFLSSSKIIEQQSHVRHRMGRIFNRVIRIFFELPIADTQCGFKLISKAALRAVLPHFTVRGFVWDVQLILLTLVKGFRVKEIGIVWQDIPGSQVKVWRDGLSMLLSLIPLYTLANRAKPLLGRVVQ